MVGRKIRQRIWNGAKHRAAMLERHGRQDHRQIRLQRHRPQISGDAQRDLGGRATAPGAYPAAAEGRERPRRRLRRGRACDHIVEPVL